MRQATRVAILLSATVLALAGCGEGTCDSAGLRDALAGAVAGDVIEVGRCRVEGSFVVPEGVTLRGSGSDSVLAGGNESVVELTSGTSPARLEHLTVESRARVAVAVRGGGAAELSDVEVEIVRGIGIGIEAGSATLSAVRIAGPVTAENAGDARWIRVLGAPAAESACPSEPCDCMPGAIDEGGGRLCDESGAWATWTATFGVYARGATLTLTDVQVSGIAGYGVVTDACETTISGGGVYDVVGVGVLARGGSAELSDFVVERVAQGLRGVASYGLIATDGAALVTVRTRVADGERYGILQLDASGSHTDLTVRDNGDVGVWVGASNGFSVAGASTVAGNGFAGVVIADSRAVHIEDASIEDTRSVRRNTGIFGAQEIGDGLHLSGSYTDVRLSRLGLRGNARAGILVDLGASSPDIVFDAVTVDASGAAYGAVAGARDDARGVITVSTATGWDSGITRSGAAVTNDAVASGELDAIVTPGPDAVDAVRGIVAPMY